MLALKLLGHGMSGFFPMSSDLVPVYFVHKKKKSWLAAATIAAYLMSKDTKEMGKLTSCLSS